MATVTVPLVLTGEPAEIVTVWEYAFPFETVSVHAKELVGIGTPLSVARVHVPLIVGVEVFEVAFWQDKTKMASAKQATVSFFI